MNLKVYWYYIKTAYYCSSFLEDSQMSLQYSFWTAHNTVSTIVRDVCPAIYKALKDNFVKVREHKHNLTNEWGAICSIRLHLLISRLVH